MSAGFKLDDTVFWGSNGAIEAYLEALAEQATLHLGRLHPVARHFRSERECFFTGAVVDLAPIAEDIAARARLLELFDLATDPLLGTGTFSEAGRLWVRDVIGDLRRRLSDSAAPSS